MQQPGNKPAVAIVSTPSVLNKQAAESLVAYLVDILTPISEKLFLIAGSSPYGDERIRYIKVRRWRDREKDFILFKLISRLLTDLKITFGLLRIANQINVIIYYVGTKGYLLSLLMARLLRKKIVMCSASSSPRAAEVMRKDRSIVWDSAIPPSIISVLERASFALSHRIWVQSKSVITVSGLGRFEGKTYVCDLFYVDATHFLLKTELKKRESVIGYVGRFDENKGVLNLVRAIPIILENHEKIEFVLLGGGPLLPRIYEEIERINLVQKVRLTGEIPRDKVGDCMNELKLLVLPSYVDGLPHVIKEAMACGTPVLATPVGGVPDLVEDSETGFIMEDNSPECIARNVIRALEHSHLEEIAQNARTLIEREYTYEGMVEKCRAGLEELMK